MARVNIVKRIKADGRWVMRSVPKKPTGEWDWKSLPEGRYYVEWYDEGARRREQAGSTVAQALEVQRRKKHQIDGLQLGLVSTRKVAPTLPTPIDSSRALRVLINRYLDQVETLKKPNTYRKYEAVLNRFADYFKDRQFEAISTEELNDFVVHLKKSGMEETPFFITWSSSLSSSSAVAAEVSCGSYTCPNAQRRCLWHTRTRNSRGSSAPVTIFIGHSIRRS